MRIALGEAIFFAHCKFAANEWAIIINGTQESIAIEGGAPAVVEARHDHAATWVNVYVALGYASVGNEHDF